MPNHLGTYGTPPMILLHSHPQVKYPTEVLACAHIYNPDDARFTPAPVGVMRVWCCGCRSLRPTEAFHRHTKRSGGYQAFCKTCQKAHRKAKRLKRDPQINDHWYRDASPVSNVSQK